MATSLDILLAGLVDDAGLFASSRTATRRAVERHRSDQAGRHFMLTHRLLCPVGKWEELRTCLLGIDRVEVGLVFDTAERIAPVGGESDPRIRVGQCEITARGGEATAAVRFLRRRPTGDGGRSPVYIEFERERGWLDAVAELSGAFPACAKIRCGGGRAGPLPGAGELGDFLRTCARHGVAFKVAGGPCHAVRHRDPATGAHHYGYGNLLLATAEAVASRAADGVETALLLDDPRRLASELERVPVGTALRVRELLRGYGSCDPAGAVRDAARLGLLRPVSCR